MEYSNAYKIQGGMFIYHKGEEYFKRDDGKCFRIFRSVVETRIRECEESELPPLKKAAISYNINYGDKRWVTQRKRVLERDGYVCRICGASNRLCVHHIKYGHDGTAYVTDDADLITLCQKCHRNVHAGNLRLQQYETIRHSNGQLTTGCKMEKPQGDVGRPREEMLEDEAHR